MGVRQFLKNSYLFHLSQPAIERSLYRLVSTVCPASIVEIGLGNGVRAQRMIELASQLIDGRPLRYTGIDCFESRQEGAGLSLKQAHRLLIGSPAAIRFVPGDCHVGLSHAANQLAGTDLIIISASADAASLPIAWYFVPRMLHGKSVVAYQSGPAAPFVVITREQIESWASTGRSLLRRAA